MSCYIGGFQKVHNQQMLKKYEYHRMLFCLLGKYKCKKIRHVYVLEDNNAVMKECDYNEALHTRFNIEIQSEEFEFKHTLSIEGSTFEYHNKYHNDESNQGKVKMHFTHIFQMNLLRMLLLNLSI